MDRPSNQQVRSALADVDLPLSKQALVAEVERRATADAVLRAVRALPLGDYTTVDEVVRSVDTLDQH